MSAKKDAILAKYGVKPSSEKMPSIPLTAAAGGANGGPAPASVPGMVKPGKKDAILAKYGVKPGGENTILAKQSVTPGKGSGGEISTPGKSDYLSGLAPTGKSEEENLRQESRLRSQLAKGVSPETLRERAKQREQPGRAEAIETDRREAGQLGAKLRLGEATDRDVTDYLGKIKEDYGFVPATASLEEMLDQTQSYLRSQQPKAATYAELAAEERDPLSRITNTVTGAAKQFGGNMAQTVSTTAKYIQPSTGVNMFRGFPARNFLVDQAVDVLLDPAKEKLVEGTQSVADKLKDSGTEDIARAQQGLNPAGRFLVNTGASLTQMAGDAAIAAVTGGSSMIPMLARSFGSGVQEAQAKGYNEKEQLALGFTNAATEYFTERLFGGNPIYDDDVGLVNWLVGKVVKNPTAMKVLSSVPVETGSEGLEGIIGSLLNPVWEWVITGNQPEYKLDELIEEGAVGALTALLAQGGTAVAGKITGYGNNLDTQGGERYDVSKEIELGGLKDGRGEETGRLDAGVEENGGRDDRTVLWRETKAVDGGRRSKSEGTGAFVGRAKAEGKTVFQTGEWRYAYRLTAEEDYASATQEAMETAKEWGIMPVVVDCFERNNGKKTFFETEAATGPKGQVILVNGRGKEEIAHEGLHSGLIRKIPETQYFMKKVMELEISADRMNYVLKRISSAYYDQGGYNFSFDHLKEETAAYLSGMIETGRVEKIFGLTKESNPEIFTAWQDFKSAMGANPMPQVNLEGDGPVSYSLDALPKRPNPLVSDTTADEILRDRTAISFLARKGGLELKSNMTQDEKRQAVAVEGRN